MSIYDHALPKMIKVILASLSLNQQAKNQFNSSIHFCDTSDLTVPWLKSSFLFFQTFTQIFFNQLVISMNFYQHGKNRLFYYFVWEKQAILLFCSKNMVDLNILQSDCPRAFWSISQKPDFSQIWDFRGNIEKQLTAKLFNEFGPFFLFSGDKNFLVKYLALSCTTSYGFLIPCQNLEKSNDPVPRKYLGGWMGQ